MTALERLEQIVNGIEREEIVGGWWETSTGVAFGARVKRQLVELVTELARPRQEMRVGGLRLIKIGERYINPDLVTRLSAEKGRATETMELKTMLGQTIMVPTGDLVTGTTIFFAADHSSWVAEPIDKVAALLADRVDGGPQ